MTTQSTGIGADLHLHRSMPSNARGTALLTTVGLSAVLELGERLVVHVAVHAATAADARWEVWQVLRRLRSLHPISEWRVQASADIDDDLLLTIALDVHNAANGKLELIGRAGLLVELTATATAEDLYRHWVNQDPVDRTSLRIAADVQAFADSRADVQAEILDEKQLRAAGLNLLIAVGEASSVSPPRLVIARYTPPGSTGKPLMLLGKGITFDSGGINVKPYESFVSMMKNDMAGAALAWSLFRALVADGHSEPLVCVLPTCENPIGENAMRPGALVRSYRGHRVRIDHTDAEGRLVLADGLAWASEKYEPRQVICFATLTTAALISYGPYATPVHFADADLQRRLQGASDALGEDLHFFTDRAWHREANRDQEADLKNTARLPGHASRAAGSRNAAHFLRFFTDAPFCHADIFASTWNWAGDAPGAGFGATGAPLRTWLRALREPA